MAKLRIWELKQIAKARWNKLRKRQPRMNWSAFEVETLDLGHKVRKIRAGAVSSALAVPVLLILNLSTSENYKDIAAAIFLSAIMSVIFYGLWRLTYRVARQYAYQVNNEFDEDVAPDPEHPSVIYGFWIPPASRGFIDWYRKFRSRFK